MQLEIFQFIDQVMDKINRDSYIYDTGQREMASYFENLFAREDYFLNLTSRVKTPNSVKEKILRQSLYIQYNDVDQLMENMPDMIGLRIGCRFIPDEKLVYEKIVDTFCVRVEDGYFRPRDNDNIVLKLDEPQPQVQKNGLDIYKIDGYYKRNGGKYNFELQIKSLVNNFWGDIEHKILYKNYSYLLGEEFIVSMMNSINESLSLIDRQLRVVYEYVYSSRQNYSNIDQVKQVMAKVIYDKYFQMIRDQLGFVVDFKPIVEIIVDFVFYQATEIRDDEFGTKILQILENTSKAQKDSQNLDDKIIIDFDLEFESAYAQQVGDKVLNLVNKDFMWNLLFKITIEVTNQDKKEVFQNFVFYLVDRFATIIDKSLKDARFYDDDKVKVKAYMARIFMESYDCLPHLESYNQDLFKELEFTLTYFLRDLSSYESFLNYQDELRSIIREIIS